MTDDWVEGGGQGEVVNKMELCRIMGLALSTIDRAILEGAPVIARGNRSLPWRINTADFLAFYTRWKKGEVTRDDDGASEAKRRLMAARMVASERKTAAVREQTITMAEARTAINQERENIRENCLAMPRRVAPALVGQQDAATVEAMIADACNELVSDIREGKRL